MVPEISARLAIVCRIRNLYDKWSDVYALYREIVDPKVTFDDYLGSGIRVAPQESWQTQLLIGDDSID